MSDANVFNTFSFKRWADQKKKANIDDESLKRRMEQVNRLKEKLAHERRLLEDAAANSGKKVFINEFDIEKLIDHLNLGHQITEDGPTLQHEEEKKPEEKEERKVSRPSSSKEEPKKLKKRPASMVSLRSDSRASINSTRSLKIVSPKDQESDDEDEVDAEQLYQKKDDEFILKELLNYYEQNNHSFQPNATVNSQPLPTSVAFAHNKRFTDFKSFSEGAAPNKTPSKSVLPRLSTPKEIKFNHNRKFSSAK
ncbi:hypothetical protein QR680_013649 [Steinernema hermaphroditum]|uniref:Uncharacterized protein n=1 Tax=Steinernema hermaphroditum TaxID=289476 RepID=A0AA39I668_9BILA|nr:hypothetical protein QR680_013649 [Steinernema hermaphroditum]